mmetsp:Transcript_26285/g.54871  ORF Transcript_26285/g.54871 Transcript_26285/m.54871 type:complete len:352 (+) Transcript_26285:137-1192(+)
MSPRSCILIALTTSVLTTCNNSRSSSLLCHALSSQTTRQSIHVPPSSTSDNLPPTRRSFVQKAAASSAIFLPLLSPLNGNNNNANAAAPLPLLTSSSTSPQRIEEIGGGFDLLSPTSSSSLSSSDVFYPSSMSNTQWKVQRVVTSVEGELGQAAVAWKCLGGGEERAFTSKLTEAYNVRFVDAPVVGMSGNGVVDDAQYEFEGKRARGCILDRKFEILNRVGKLLQSDDVISWGDDDGEPGSISYARNDYPGRIELKTVQRSIEPPSEAGFGSDELIRIQSSAGGGALFVGSNVYRCARVKRRFRRGFDESTGKRIIDGIEIMLTYRVLDGVAGVEMPTSTSKSRIRMTEL